MCRHQKFLRNRYERWGGQFHGGMMSRVPTAGNRRRIPARKSPLSTAPLVKRLEAASLATRTRNRDDERRVIVSLTRHGRELREKSGCLGQALLTHSGMEPNELISLNLELQGFREHLASAEETRAVGA